MSITIQTAGVLRQHLPEELHVEAQTVGEAIQQLDLPATGELLFLVNGRMAHWQTQLIDGDVLKLIPAIGGGRSWPRLPHADSFPHNLEEQS